MAQTTFTFTPNTYAGSLLAGYMSRAILGTKLVEDGLITVIDNIKKRKILLDIDDEIEFKTWSPAFVGQANNVTRGESYLDPIKYEVAKEYTFEQLIQSWEADGLKPGSFQDTDGEVNLVSWLEERNKAKIALGNEKLYILGKSATPEAKFAAAFPGLLPLIRANAGTFKIPANSGEFAVTGISKAVNAVLTHASNANANLEAGDTITLVGVVGMTEINGLSGQVISKTATTTTVGINSTAFTTYTSGGTVRFINKSNVIAILSSIHSLIKKALRQQPDLKLQVSSNVMDAYAFAQASVANGAGRYFLGTKEMDFLGRTLIEMPHWEDNTIMVARTSNLFLGVDLIGDGSEIRSWNLKETTGDEIIRYKCVMKADVAAKFYDEILIYSPLV